VSTSEVPTTDATYPNPVPTLGDTGIGQSAMPASFYLSGPPSWWQGEPWPPIGPDVTGGTVDLSNGTTSWVAQTVGGHANNIPALDCFMTVMGGPADGSGSVLAFDSAACFSSTPTVAIPTFSPVAGTYTATQSVAISTITAGATICWTNDGTTPTANGAGTCTHGTTYSGAISITVNQTLRAKGSLSGDADSSTGTAAYILQGSAPTFSPVAGTYATAQTVTLSQAQSLSMCYTTNGTTPASTGTGSCAGGSTLYTGPISVSVTQTVKAIGFANGWTDSNVGSALYTITAVAVPSNSVAAFGVKFSGGAVIK